MGLLDEAIREHLELKRRRGADPSEIDRLEREALGPVRRTPHDAPDPLDQESLGAGAYPEEEEIPYGLDEGSEWRDAPADRERSDRADASGLDTAAPDRWEDTEITSPSAHDYEPETSENAYDQPRHHEIAEEWEAHERQGLVAETAGFEPDEPAPVPPAPAARRDEPSDLPPPGDAPGPVFGGERRESVAPEEYDVEQETMEHDVEAEELRHPNERERREREDVLEETPDFLQDTPDHDRLWFEQRPPRDFDFED